ncbi:MAG TPA: alpha/beta fold hydrolase [Bacteroidales bacterium]|nr:alpha/beta fold hydrolase [Bacteroidales bacterium]
MMMNKNFRIVLFAITAMFLGLTAMAQQAADTLSLDLIFNTRTFAPKSVRGIRPMNGGERYTQIKRDSINAYSYQTGLLTDVIVTSDQLTPEGETQPIALYNYEFSDDETKILFGTNTEPIYRRSSRSDYYIFDLKTKNLKPLSGNGKQQLATFSPDGEKVAFVRDNNLFIKDLTTNEEHQITRDGKPGSIINGTTDWVYEEEFAVVKGFDWSPDSRYLAFMRFDESNVKQWQLTTYGELYPERDEYKYPKAGEDNSLVTVQVYDVNTGKIMPVDVGEETDQYIPRIFFTPDPQVLAVLRVNRLQNHLDVLYANLAGGATRTVYSEDNEFYIDDSNYDNISFLGDGSRFIITSERSGFNHIYLFDIKKQEMKAITSGDFDVTELIAVDEKNEKVFYQAAIPTPMDRQVFSVSFNGKNKTLLTPRKGTNSARFSADNKYFIQTWSDANTPPVYSVNKGKNGETIRILEDNQELLATRAKYNLQPRTFFTITTPEGVTLNAWKILPFDFDSTRQYPVLFDIYGGPGSQTVTNNYRGGELYNQYLAKHGIMVVSVDNRGTGARGEAFKKMTYRQLGKYETIDQIEAARYLGQLPYIDSNRIAVFGWSYGGFMSTLLLTKGAGVFDVGVAVAPVTNWRYYDNIYTERFMRTPQENPEGYDDNSPINHVEKLQGDFLLIHGMSDDNVHPQNSIDLITALVAADKDFDLMFYPNSNHGIYTGKNTRMHLYKKITSFLMGHLE